MKSTYFKSLPLSALIILISIFNTGCIGDYIENYTGYGTINNEPNVPDTYNGRPVDVQGTLYVNNKNVTFYVWDSGSIDGDIISLIVNGKELVSYYTLTGSKKAVYATLNKGYNYVLLYAHNEGNVSPNTAALSIDDGSGEQQIILSANLSTNAAYNIVLN
jgi:hypothetical protein